MKTLSRLLGKSDAILIHTDKQEYFGGEKVTGKVIFSVTKPEKIRGIHVSLIGTEKVEFQVKRSRSIPAPTKENPNARKTETYYKLCKEKNELYNRKYCIWAARNTLMPGQYVFPFELQLDVHLPGTFSLPNSDRFKFERPIADISYSIHVEVDIPGMFNVNFRHQQMFMVKESLRSDIFKTVRQQTSNVTFLCCISKGSVFLDAVIDKNAYAPGHQVSVGLKVDASDCQVELKKLSLKLVRRLELWAQNEKLRSVETVVKASTAAIQIGEIVDRNIHMSLPWMIEPSAMGRLIKCSYELKVVLSVPWSPDVICSQPVQIYALPIKSDYVEKLDLPPDYGQIFPVAKLNEDNSAPSSQSLPPAGDSEKHINHGNPNNSPPAYNDSGIAVSEGVKDK